MLAGGADGVVYVKSEVVEDPSFTHSLVCGPSWCPPSN
jgi:hypothetical protein